MAMPSRHVLTIQRFERMVEAGVFDPGERVELIEGELVDMSPIGAAHLACVNRLNAVMTRAVGDDAIVQVQGAIRLGDISRPEPDIALLRYREDFYVGGLPMPGDVLLVVEVADTSARYDRWTKLPLYAAAGIPEAWVVDLNAGVVDVATDPSAEGYGTLHQAKATDTIAPAAFPHVALTVARVLGVPGA
jgi:Uma2 family endonuclease